MVGRTGDDGTKKFKIRVPLSNFCRTLSLEMPLINCKVSLIITWSNRCFIIDNPISGQEPTFASTNTKFYLVVVTLSIQDNGKLLEQLKSGFKRTINWKKYEPKVRVEQ